MNLSRDKAMLMALYACKATLAREGTNPHLFNLVDSAIAYAESPEEPGEPVIPDDAFKAMLAMLGDLAGGHARE